MDVTVWTSHLGAWDPIAKHISNPGDSGIVLCVTDCARVVIRCVWYGVVCVVLWWAAFYVCPKGWRVCVCRAGLLRVPRRMLRLYVQRCDGQAFCLHKVRWDALTGRLPAFSRDTRSIYLTPSSSHCMVQDSSPGVMNWPPLTGRPCY